MKPLKVYLAGPMKGVPYLNFPAFFAAEKVLKNKGFKVFSAARRDIKLYGKNIACATGLNEKVAEKKGFSLRTILSYDCQQLCKSDIIAFLPRWEESKGCQAEYYLSVALGLPKILMFKSKGEYRCVYL